MAGLYIHIPFCRGKCPYCDFYSLPCEEGAMDAYVRRTEAVLAQWGGMPITTIYFGGGTPSLLGPERLSRLLRQARKSFPLAPPGEVTLEANPTHVNEAFFAALAEAGFTRLSMGMQSADQEELKLLGRAHSPENVKEAVKAAQRAGFRNISLDMMLGLPGGSREKLGRTIAFASGLGVQHISAYILKVEPDTPFASAGLVLPDGDETAEEYLFCVEELARQGFFQYEISNFSHPGFESRHNLIYWQGEEYLGIGPGAHSFQNGRRFYFPRDLEGFLAGSAPADDGPGGSFPEYAMLRLRLTEGLSEAGCGERFGPAGERAFRRLLENAKTCPPHLIRISPQSLRFTPEGFLVSNALLLRLLEGAEA